MKPKQIIKWLETTGGTTLTPKVKKALLQHIREVEPERKEVLVYKIVDFTKDKDEPAYDLEVYSRGKYIGSPHHVFSTKVFKSKENAWYNMILELQRLVHNRRGFHNNKDLKL